MSTWRWPDGSVTVVDPTSAVTLSPDGAIAARPDEWQGYFNAACFEGRYGKASLPDEPNVYKSKSGSNVQDAHEAMADLGVDELSMTPPLLPAVKFAVRAMKLADAKKLLASLPAANAPTDLAFYLQHCVKACEGGVERSHILPFAVDGALLLEIYMHDGIGTMVVDEKLEELREATHEDVGGILQLIEPFEKDGTLVRRDRTEIERDIGQYSVMEHDGVIFGCAALYPYAENQTAEMAALTVSPHTQGQGDGEKILKRIEHRARALGLKSIFVLTTRTTHWFLKRGFVQVDPDWLPQARQRKYNWDRKSQVLVKHI